MEGDSKHSPEPDGRTKLYYSNRIFHSVAII